MGCGIDDEWLQKKIEEDLNAMADEREKQLMEMHELQNIQMPREKLEDIYREAERRRKVVRKKKIRYRMVAALAATLVLCVGAGVISSGNKVYVPEIFQREVGDDTTTKINNADAVASQYDEEDICRAKELNSYLLRKEIYAMGDTINIYAFQTSLLQDTSKILEGLREQV